MSEEENILKIVFSPNIIWDDKGILSEISAFHAIILMNKNLYLRILAFHAIIIMPEIAALHAIGNCTGNCP